MGPSWRLVMAARLDATLRLLKETRLMHRGNRHGRSEQARVAVLEAADDLLAEQGFARLTVEAIAQRAGVAKQTIYRWWPSKPAILLEAFLTDAAEELSPPDSGDLATDLTAHLT